ncbi:MAG: triose-phosphate isomerase [bacterium]|nr:triose-phosphate isomerase [bacterium]
MRRKKLIVANWKMHPGSMAEARSLFGKTKRAGSRLEKVETVICPPFAYLGAFAHGGTSRVFLGAQDVFYSNSGRATGEVSPEMLRDLGVTHVIVGHSERRALGETNELVARKAVAVLAEGMQAIVCIGEKERDEGGAFYETLKVQLKESLQGIARRFFIDLIIAYEPLWAIGKSAKEASTPKDVQEMSIFIRKVLTDLYGKEAAQQPSVLYGGAVEEENAGAILSSGGVQGLLVGHKSLDAEAFARILKSANAV